MTGQGRNYSMNQEGNFRQRLSLTDLTFIGLGSMVGSGWLFASQRGAQIAGPAAWISWIIGAFAVTLLGLVYAELGGMLPRAGGTVRYPDYSHGPLVGYLTGFASIIAFASVAGIEAEAMRQYADTWWPSLGSNGPTLLGWFVQCVLLVIFFLLNFASVNLFGKSNTIITSIKFIVPTLTIVTLLFFFKPTNFTMHGFAPQGFSGIESAVSTAGIIFAFLGFQQAVSFSSEAKHPQRNVPISIFLAVFLAAALYILLQTTFVGAMPNSKLGGGWSALSFTSPFANLATVLGMGWLGIIVLADAVISPSGTANIYLSATSRVIFAWARTGTFFRVFKKVDSKSGVPRPALWLAFFLAVFFTLPFPSWNTLVGVVSSASVLTYILGPVSLHAFRHRAPNLPRPFRLKALSLISPASFVVASLIIYWTGWGTDAWLLSAELLMFVIYVIFIKKSPTRISPLQQIKASIWMVAYFAMMMVVSYLGSFGGIKVLPNPWDQVMVVIVSLGVYYWGVYAALPSSVMEFAQDEETQSERVEEMTTSEALYSETGSP